MKDLIKGINVTLYNESGQESVSNVLVGEPASAASTVSTQDPGELLTYTLAIPKGDTHDWVCRKVGFFGKLFRTVGQVSEGIEENIPLRWNRKIKAELLITNGSVTLLEKNSLSAYIFRDVNISDERGRTYQKNGEHKKNELIVNIYAVNIAETGYVPKTGDILLIGEIAKPLSGIIPDNEKRASEYMAELRKRYDYAVVSSVEKRSYGNKYDYIVKAV